MSNGEHSAAGELAGDHLLDFLVVFGVDVGSGLFDRDLAVDQCG